MLVKLVIVVCVSVFNQWLSKLDHLYVPGILCIRYYSSVLEFLTPVQSILYFKTCRIENLKIFVSLYNQGKQNIKCHTIDLPVSSRPELRNNGNKEDNQI
jgi:hypothetical protein